MQVEIEVALGKASFLPRFLAPLLGRMEVGSGLGGSSAARESHRRRKTVWKDAQKLALLRSFAKCPYPNFRAREELAREIGVPESRVRVWFQNRRSRTGLVRQGPGSTGASSRVPESQQQPEKSGAGAQGSSSSPSRRTRHRTHLSSPQLKILTQAFERHRYPGIAAREELAQRTGLPEDTIYIWFQNRRARYRAAGKGGFRGADCHSSPVPNALSAGSQTELARDSSSSLPAAEAEPSPTGDPETRAVARNTCPLLQLCLDPLLTEFHDGPPVEQDGLNPYEHWENLQPSPEAPLDEEEYQALLEDLGNTLGKASWAHQGCLNCPEREEDPYSENQPAHHEMDLPR